MIKIDFNDFYDYVLNLCDKLSHRVDEQNETIECLQTENKKLKSCLTIADNDYKKCYAENIRLAEENNKLQNDLQQSVNEIKLLNNQIDNLQRNVVYLCEENIRLRHELNEVKTIQNDNYKSHFGIPV